MLRGLGGGAQPYPTLKRTLILVWEENREQIDRPKMHKLIWYISNMQEKMNLVNGTGIPQNTMHVRYTLRETVVAHPGQRFPRAC